jgi:hypothetical protein
MDIAKLIYFTIKCIFLQFQLILCSINTHVQSVNQTPTIHKSIGANFVRDVKFNTPQCTWSLSLSISRGHPRWHPHNKVFGFKSNCLKQNRFVLLRSLLLMKIKYNRVIIREPSWLWSYGSWIYNYLCNQCLSPLMLWVRISIRAR